MLNSSLNSLTSFLLLFLLSFLQLYPNFVSIKRFLNSYEGITINNTELEKKLNNINEYLPRIKKYNNIVLKILNDIEYKHFEKIINLDNETTIGDLIKDDEN